MTTENMANWIQSWDKPIGALIDSFTDFDRDFVAVLQAQLLAIHRAGTGENLYPSSQEDAARAKDVNLFALLNTGASGIGLKIQELGINHYNVVMARADVDKNKDLPRAVPPFGLIAKVTGIVTPEICDQILTVQAAARIMKNARMALENAPSLNDALDDKRYAFIGKDDTEPKELQIAQSYAHLALIHQALIKEMPVDSGVRYDGAFRQSAYASIAHGIIEQARDTLGKLGVDDAVKNIDAVLPEFAAIMAPLYADSVTAIASQISWLHHDVIGGEYNEEKGHQASIIHHRMLIISGVTNNGSAPGNDPKLTL